jgi:asparagine N-glycosylation enzyme membrane subunit Stt3
MRSKKLLLLTLLLFVGIQLFAQTRATTTTNVGVVIMSASDTSMVFNMVTKPVAPSIQIKEGTTTKELLTAFDRPLSVVKMNNGKEKWTYDSTIVYINNGVVDIVRHLKK